MSPWLRRPPESWVRSCLLFSEPSVLREPPIISASRWATPELPPEGGWLGKVTALPGSIVQEDQSVVLLALEWLEPEASAGSAAGADRPASEVQPNPADGSSARRWSNLKGWKQPPERRHSQALADWESIGRLRARSPLLCALLL